MSSPLVLLAAGMGTRFGGPKQLAEVGPRGEPLFAVTVAAAATAGFDRFVLVTRAELEQRMREQVAAHLPGQPVEVVLQDVRSSGRARPWGTAHAVALCTELDLPAFGVANADDVYGPGALRCLAEGVRVAAERTVTIVGYRLGETLSAHGGVSRAVCELDDGGRVARLVEEHGLVADAEGPGVHGERGRCFRRDDPVSMNLFALPACVPGLLAERFAAFAAAHRDEPDAEYTLPTEVDRLRSDGLVEVRLAMTDEPWAGLTHPADLAEVRRRLAQDPTSSL